MRDELTTVFVTMHAKGDMRLFDWRRHVEELRFMVGQLVQDKDWGELSLYGPDTEGFEQLPCICIQARLTRDALNTLTDTLADDLWISVPINLFVARAA